MDTANQPQTIQTVGTDLEGALSIHDPFSASTRRLRAVWGGTGNVSLMVAAELVSAFAAYEART